MAIPIWMRVMIRPDRKGRNLRTQVIDYLVIIGLFIAVTVVCKTTGSFFNLTDVAMLYLIPVLYAGVLLFDLLFVPPLYVFSVADLHYLVTFAIFLVVAISMSLVSSKLRWQAEETRLAISQLRTLYDLSKELPAVTEISDFAEIMARE